VKCLLPTKHESVSSLIKTKYTLCLSKVVPVKKPVICIREVLVRISARVLTMTTETSLGIS
jgi:hypothetical protein